MVTDSENRRQDSPADGDRADRGQLILIGAITLAFIVLGVVVVFNGVVYTETLSSADTGQSANAAERTELEVERGVACVLAENDEPTILGSEVEDEIEEFGELYANATTQSTSAGVTVETDPTLIYVGQNATVTITYDSHDVSYERERTISADDCPTNS